MEKPDKSSKRVSPRKDMKDKHVATIEEFLKSSFIWAYVINLHREFHSVKKKNITPQNIILLFPHPTLSFLLDNEYDMNLMPGFSAWPDWGRGTYDL